MEGSHLGPAVVLPLEDTDHHQDDCKDQGQEADCLTASRLRATALSAARLCGHTCRAVPSLAARRQDHMLCETPKSWQVGP